MSGNWILAITLLKRYQLFNLLFRNDLSFNAMSHLYILINCEALNSRQSKAIYINVAVCVVCMLCVLLG